MKHHPWTLALVSAGLVSMPAIIQAEEKPNSLATALSATTISGYVDTSMQWNFGTGDDRLPPYAFGGTGKADGFNMNVAKISIAKPMDLTETWAAGYQLDLLFGPDANALATQSSGIPADFAIQQAYVALRAPVGNGLDFKVGVFNSPLGYEVFESGSNPNFTRSYGYTIEPTTLTGISVGYQFCENFSAVVGVADSFGPTIDGRSNPPQAESFKTYFGSVTGTAPKDWGFLAGSTASFGIINGYNSTVANNPTAGATSGGNETSYYVGTTINTPVTGLKAGAAFDYMNVHNTSGETWALGGYLSFQCTEKLSLYGRAEYLRDRGNQKFFQAVGLDSAGDPVVYDTAPDKVLALTATAQYDLWKNVISRIELRWDHSLNGVGVWGTANVDTLEGTLKNEWVLLANFIYKF